MSASLFVANVNAFKRTGEKQIKDLLDTFRTIELFIYLLLFFIVPPSHKILDEHQPTGHFPDLPDGQSAPEFN